MLTVMALAFWLIPSAPVQSQSPAQSPQVAAAVLPSLAPGVYNLRLEREDGPTIRYAISIPRNYAAGARVPLVLVLHFGGDPVGAGWSLLDMVVRPMLAELGAIIIAPDSLGGNWSVPQNERAAMALLDAAQRSYSVDPKKVVVTGFSMGGAGTWHLAETYPERFSAAIPMAGRPSGTAATWRVPVFAVHSRDDEVAPIGPTEQRIQELKALGKNAEIVVSTGIAHHDTVIYGRALRNAVPWLKELWK